MFGRFFYAFAMATAILMIVMVADMLFAFDVGEYIFSPYVFFPVVTVCYLFAPVIKKYIKLS